MARPLPLASLAPRYGRSTTDARRHHSPKHRRRVAIKVREPELAAVGAGRDPGEAEGRTHGPSGNPPVTRHRRGPGLARVAAAAGVVGPLLFVVGSVGLTGLQYDFLQGLGWHPVADSPVPWPSALALWRPLRRDPAWRAYGAYSLAAGIAALLLLLTSLLVPGPLTFYGLLVVAVVWLEALALRLWRLTRPAAGEASAAP
jgi:hypothetical protein